MKVIVSRVDKIGIGQEVVRGCSSRTKINTFWIRDVISDFYTRRKVEGENVPSRVIIGCIVIDLTVGTGRHCFDAIHLVAVDDVVPDDGAVAAARRYPAATDLSVACRVMTASRDDIAINDVVVRELRR